MASNGQQAGRSGCSLSKRRKSVKNGKDPKVTKRGFSIAELEILRLQRQMTPGTSVLPHMHENLSTFQMHGDSSAPSFWHTSHPTPSSTHVPQKMGMGSTQGCDVGLGLSTRLANENEDIEFRQPNYFTNLLLAEDSQEEKETATDSTGPLGSLAAAGSSSKEELDLELRL